MNTPAVTTRDLALVALAAVTVVVALVCVTVLVAVAHTDPIAAVGITAGADGVALAAVGRMSGTSAPPPAPGPEVAP